MLISVYQCLSVCFLAIATFGAEDDLPKWLKIKFVKLNARIYFHLRNRSTDDIHCMKVD